MSCVPLLASILSEQSVFRELALAQKLPTPEVLSDSKEQLITSHYLRGTNILTISLIYFLNNSTNIASCAMQWKEGANAL